MASFPYFLRNHERSSIIKDGHTYGCSQEGWSYIIVGPTILFFSQFSILFFWPIKDGTIHKKGWCIHVQRIQRKIHKYRRIRMSYIKKDDAYMCTEFKKNTQVQKKKDVIHKVYNGIPTGRHRTSSTTSSPYFLLVQREEYKFHDPKYLLVTHSREVRLSEIVHSHCPPPP